MSFESRLKEVASEVDEVLELWIGDDDETAVRKAMVHAALGGKKFRAFLVVESCGLFGVDYGSALQTGAAIEAMHAYSLVHDDLPCMDDDDMRRGKPTLHRKWDEATAVLAGDALQSLAFDLITGLDEPAVQVVDLTGRLARAAGVNGMVLGQAQDIEAESAKTPLSLDAVTALQANKTGALIKWSAEAGAILGDSDPSQLGRFASALGLAFQIADDLLDETGDEEKTGKRLKKDAGAGKATFVSHLGLEGAKDRARALVADAVDALSIYDARANSLRDAARFVISREH